MTLGEIFTRIETGIQDPSFTREKDILPLVNGFVSEMSQLFRLPWLQEESSVGIAADPAVNYISLPSDYDRELYLVHNNTTSRDCSIRSNVKTLERMYRGWKPNGGITDVAVGKGNRELWFRPLPTQAQDLTLLYYRKPIVIEDVFDGDVELDGIPEHLSKFAVDYVLWQLFTLVEDGIEGRPMNTEKYFSRYQLALAEFQEYCKKSPKQIPAIVRTARFF